MSEEEPSSTPGLGHNCNGQMTNELTSIENGALTHMEVLYLK